MKESHNYSLVLYQSQLSIRVPTVFVLSRSVIHCSTLTLLTVPATFHAPSHILTVLGTAVVHEMPCQHLRLYCVATLPAFPINMYDPRHENSGVVVLQIKVQFKKMTT